MITYPLIPPQNTILLPLFDMSSTVHHIARKYPDLLYDTCPVCRDPALTGHHRIYITTSEECNICKNTVDTPYSLPCGHIFCMECIVSSSQV